MKESEVFRFASSEISNTAVYAPDDVSTVPVVVGEVESLGSA